MRVIVKRPHMEPEITEVEGISAINQLVGNVDEAGNGWNHGGTDIRMAIFKGIDQYVKDDAANNLSLEENLWDRRGMCVFCGTIVFAGYDNEIRTNCGACSLTDEQIEKCLDYIEQQKA